VKILTGWVGIDRLASSFQLHDGEIGNLRYIEKTRRWRAPEWQKSDAGAGHKCMAPYSIKEHSKITNEISALYEELRREIEILGKAQSSSPNVPTRFADPADLTDVDRRLLVRSIFSFVEALSYSLKVLALSSTDSSSLGPGERMLAAEEGYELSTSGCVETRRAKLPTLGNVRFAFDILAKVEGGDFSLDVSHQGWQLLQRSIKVRDRLMHPKALSDLHVSNEEIRSALRAFIWFESQIVNVLIATVESVEAKVKEAKLRNKGQSS
jgi:hypothetical protein